MVRSIAGSLVIAASLGAQAAGAIEIRPDQPCVRRVCVEMDWVVYNGHRIENCSRWVNELDARCASMQLLPDGIKLAPPRGTQIQPTAPLIR